VPRVGAARWHRFTRRRPAQIADADADADADDRPPLPRPPRTPLYPPQNAGRSQISAYTFNALVDPSSATAISAGSRPAEHVHEEVKVAMAEAGHDLSGAVPQKLTRELLEASGTTHCVLMGCGDACPMVPGRNIEIIEWKVPDPHGAGLEAVREIRDGLRERIEQLIDEKGLKRRSA